MVTTITLNPCIDKTVTVNGFTYGGTNYVEDYRYDISGKGINVSIALKNIGGNSRCLGLNYTSDGSIVTDFLNSKNVSYDFVNVNGHLRTNIKIFDKKTSVMSELNERGEVVDPKIIEQVLDKIKKSLSDTTLIVLTGSVPPGVPDDIYKIIAEIASVQKVKVIIDAHDKLLLEAIKAHPYLIKPNKDEFEETFGEKVYTKLDIIRAARKVIAQGVSIVCVSLGKDGAMLVTQDEAFYCSGVNIEVKGVQGAGDSLVAGMCYAIEHNLSHAEMLRYGVAAAHGSLILEGTQMCTRATFEQMLPLINVEEIKNDK